MKPKSNPESLLDDIFEECVTPEFRSQLLAETLEHVRRRRRARRGNQAFMMLAVVLAAGWFALRSHRPQAQPDWARTTPPQPASSKLLLTRPLLPSQTIASSPMTVAVIHSSPGSFATINSTRDEKPYREIGDPELLALVAGRSIALVRERGHAPELIFADGADQAGFPVP